MGWLIFGVIDVVPPGSFLSCRCNRITVTTYIVLCLGSSCKRWDGNVVQPEFESKVLYFVLAINAAVFQKVRKTSGPGVKR